MPLANESGLAMNELPPKHDTPPEPQSTTSEKFPIRKSQEEFVDDMAGPSMDKSEYDARKGELPPLRPASDAEEPARTPDQR